MKQRPSAWLSSTAGTRGGAAAAVFLACAAGPAEAQFHTQGTESRAATSPRVAAVGPGAPSVYRGETQNAGMVETGAVEGSRLGYMELENAVIWGRAIFHPDDTYTESKQDTGTNSLTQETKSPSGVTLQRRLISLDAAGRPSEILIYDGRGEFRYRGAILYNRQGRFIEEQIYDTEGGLIRRRIQEYDLQGRPLRLKVVDDMAKIPPDLKLVITRADGIDRDPQRAARNLEEFQRNAREVRPGESGRGEAEAGEKRPGLFRRLLSR